jgi:uncharacterized membrane protein
VDNPAAWHPDPAGKHDHRWWDGQRWTEHVADAGVASVDPLPDAPDAATPADATPSDAGRAPAAGETGDTTAPRATDPETSGDASTDPGATGAGWSSGAGWSGGGSSEAPGTAGPSSRSDEPVWGQRTDQQPHQQPHQQPGQQPWGSAPGAAPSWSQQQPTWGPSGGQSPSNGLAIGALVTGILSLPLLLLFGLGALLGIVAIIIGVIALRRANRGEGSGRGMAIGGIVTGAISLVLAIIGLIVALTFGMGIFSEMEACLEETGGDQAECERRLEEDLMERFRQS